MKFGKDLAFAFLVGMVSVACSGSSAPTLTDPGTDSGATFSQSNDDSGVTNPNGGNDSGSGTKDSNSGDAGASKGSGNPPDAAGVYSTADSGIAPPGPSCQGTPTPCDLLASCTTAGCTSAGGGCSGVSTACFEIFSSFGCTSQEGCYWNTSSNTCTGLSFICTENSSETSCALEQGCSWSAASCTGIPAVSCVLADTAAECGTIDGCFWD